MKLAEYEEVLLNHTSCPVCQSANATRLWSTDSECAAQHYVLKERESDRHLELVKAIENRWHAKNCNVMQCSECGFCFADPYCAGDEEFYRIAYQRTHYPRWKWEFQLTLDELQAITTNSTRLLEIGAGDGAFVKLSLIHI